MTFYQLCDYYMFEISKQIGWKLMTNRKGWRKYWYLLIASGAILSATFALLIMQHRAINRAEE